MKRKLYTLLAAGIMTVSVAGAVSAAPNDRSSEVGHCSVLYGQL